MAPSTSRKADPRINILLVDDQHANLVALEAILHDLDANLVTAGSGEDALRRQLEQDFGLILLDVRMPVLDGYETARLIRGRERSRHTPIIFLTAQEGPDFPAGQAYALGAVDYLVKPVDAASLRSKVAVFLELFQKTEQIKRQGEQLRALERQEFERQLAEEQRRQTEHRFREIDRLNAELETRVRDRTAALEAANRDLQKEITHHLRTAAELTRSNQELEQVAYVASHDLKEPLRKIRIYLQLLERQYRGRLDAKANQYIGYAVESAGRMQTLVNDLLAFARVASRGKPAEPTDCAAVFDRVVADLEPVIRETNATVTRTSLPTIPADATQMGQLFHNLIGNALKFVGGKAPVVRVEAQPRNGEWLFAVRDNGIGIEPRFAERIFVIFERLHHKTEYPGTGIGLAICKKIVERHGGCIWVESEHDKGSTFWFTLPALEGQSS